MGVEALVNAVLLGFGEDELEVPEIFDHHWDGGVVEGNHLGGVVCVFLKEPKE